MLYEQVMHNQLDQTVGFGSIFLNKVLLALFDEKLLYKCCLSIFVVP